VRAPATGAGAGPAAVHTGRVGNRQRLVELIDLIERVGFGRRSTVCSDIVLVTVESLRCRTAAAPADLDRLLIRPTPSLMSTNWDLFTSTATSGTIVC
jgi:hypothetical protein